MKDHIVKFSKGNKVNYYVYHKSGRVYRYTEKDNLPMTVVEVLLNGICYETEYTETGKIERFRKEI